MARTGNNQERVKIQNTESIKEIIYKYGPISRAEIADMLHLTPPTITTNVANLIQQGMVYECDSEEKKESSVGRRRILIDFVQHAKYAIGVECGYHGMMICLVDIRCNVIAEHRYADKMDDYEETLNTVARHIQELLDEVKGPRKKVAGIGIVCA